jgi:hypothetical protein
MQLIFAKLSIFSSGILPIDTGVAMNDTLWNSVVFSRLRPRIYGAQSASELGSIRTKR